MENELYIVIELQRNGDQMGNIVTSHTTLQDAKHKFFTVAAAATISNLERHSVSILNEKGELVSNLTFEHKED